MCNQIPEQQMYVFNEQFKQQWYSFLEQKAIYELGLTPTPTRVFLTRFKYDNWQKSIREIWQEADVNSRDSFVRQLTDIFKGLKPSCPDIGRGAKKFPIAKRCLLNEFKSIYCPDLNKNTSNKLENSMVEFFEATRQECYEKIEDPAALIRIKAPAKMGKSRLLYSVLNYTKKQQYNAIHVNLLQIERNKLNNINSFLRWFCAYLSHALKLNLELDNSWRNAESSMQSSTWYLEDILEQCEQPLLLGLDEVDRLLNYPNISQDFFALLRTWHEESKNNELWEKLRLVVVYSTEDFGTLDINRSPFNVGLPVKLESIKRSKLVELANFYGVDLLDKKVDRLMTMLGGHPYLVDRFLSHLSANELGIEKLLQQATTNGGIYDSYLRHHLANLKSNSQLTEIFVRVLDSTQPVQVDTLLGYQLYRMGLIKWSQNNTVVPSCELFRQYFLPRLKPSQ